MNITDIILKILVGLFIILLIFFLITSLTGAPYVPTLHKNLAQNLQKLYPLKSTDLLIDLGSGDGTILQVATQKQAKAIGIELNPLLAIISKLRFRKNPHVTIKYGNFYSFKFPAKTTVIYAFIVSSHINKVYSKIQQEANRLHKPLYFISNAFTVAGKTPLKLVNTFYLYKISPKTKS